MKKYKVLKVVLLITTVVFLVTAITFSILILCLENKCGCSNDNYYYVASVFAGLSIGLIPLLLAVDTEIKHNYKKEEEERNSTRDDLQYFIKLTDDKETSFITVVVNQFGFHYKIKDLYLEFLNKKKTLNECFKLLNERISQSDYESILLKCTNDAKYMLSREERDNIEGCKDNQLKYSMVVNKAVHLLNKFELLCYNFKNNESTKLCFAQQIGKIIMRFYFLSMCLVSNNKKTVEYPFIEEMIEYILSLNIKVQ